MTYQEVEDHLSEQI
jgi:hypothetical protein